MEENDLIIACKKGQKHAQEKLYKHFFGYATGIALRYCFNREDAIEVVNDSFIKIFKSIQSFDESRLFKPWLRQVVVNTAIDNRRKNLKNQYHLEIDYAVGIQADESAIDKLNAKDIILILNELPEHHKMVFNLYEIDGYSHEEIGKMMGITSSSSRVYLSRAKEKLKRLISSHFFIDHGRAI